MPIEFAIPNFGNARVSVDDVDILKERGVKVVHCSRAFDTHVSVVRGSSVFGQLLGYCRDNGIDVDGQVDAWLGQIQNKGLYKENLPFRKRMFNTGELCPVMVEDSVVCLAGFCNTTNAFTSESVTLVDYMAYWSNVWHNLSHLTIDKEHVYVTVPGGRIINISGCVFDLEQSLGVILLTYFKHVKQYAAAIPNLHICIGEAGLSQLNVDMWQNGFMEYLYRFAMLPLDVVPSSILAAKAAKTSAVGSVATKTSAFDMLLADLKEMFYELAKHNGESIEQYEGSKRVSVDVTANIEGLCAILDAMRSYPTIERYFGRQKGNSYDRNALFIMLGVLIDRTNCFGRLNRRSVVNLCLGGDDTGRWLHLGDSTENIITYVGQRMTKFKIDHEKLYNDIISSIPEDYINRK